MLFKFKELFDNNKISVEKGIASTLAVNAKLPIDVEVIKGVVKLEENHKLA